MEEITNDIMFGSAEETICDVTMIIGQLPMSKEYVLLNLRYHSKIKDAENFGEKFFYFAQKHINAGKNFTQVQ